MTSTPTPAIGTAVEIQLPPAHALNMTKWWPKTGPVTGTVQRVFKNGQVAVAIDQLGNRSEDGHRTLHLAAAFLTSL